MFFVNDYRYKVCGINRGFLKLSTFLNYNLSCEKEDWDERKISNNYEGMDYFTNIIGDELLLNFGAKFQR